MEKLFPEASIGSHWSPPPEPQTPTVADVQIESRKAPSNPYLRFPAEQDYQMDSGTMGTDSSGMR